MSITRLPERPRILVITLRRLGDVLLTTPLIRTIRRGFPQATLDVLVFRGSAPILEGNPDIDNVRTMPERPSAGETLALVRELWRRYDLVISTQAGDRPTFFAWVAARRRIGVVPPPGATGAWWKRHIHDASIAPAPDSHRVTQLLQLATALGLEPVGGDRVPAARLGRGVCAAPALRGRAREPVLPLQAMDRRRLAGARARSARARPGGGGERRSRSGRTGLYGRPVGRRRRAGGPHARAPRLGEPGGAACGRARLCRAGHLGHSSGGGNRLPDRRHLRPGQSALDGALARRRARPSRGTRPARSSTAAMSGWCRIRCPACRAKSSAAPATSTATASAWTSFPLGRCWRRSTWRCGAGRRQADDSGRMERPASPRRRTGSTARDNRPFVRRFQVSDFFGGKEISNGVYAALWH